MKMWGVVASTPSWPRGMSVVLERAFLSLHLPDLSAIAVWTTDSVLYFVSDSTVNRINGSSFWVPSLPPSFLLP